MTLPILLVGKEQHLPLTHWCDGSSRDKFKLYAGNRSAADIARAMLRGNPKKKTRGVVDLWQHRNNDVLRNPFGAVTPLGGSFNFDPRSAWTRLDAGFSLNDQKQLVAASPIVEILAAIGLQHARPLRQRESDDVRYATWRGALPPSLARAALGCSDVSVPRRTFRFTLARAGQNKVVTFADEEIA
jgi:CRISPR-associated protein Csx14